MASSAISTVGLGARAQTPMWRIRKEVVTYASLIPYIAFSLFPLYIMFITSLKSKQEINNLGASPFWATGITLDNYVYLAENTHFFDHWLLNTFIVTVVSTIISVAVGILAAYALARLRFRGVEAFGVAVFVTYLVPQALLFLPLINVINFIDDFIPIRDTYWSLILTYPTFLIPFVTWLLMGYFPHRAVRGRGVRLHRRRQPHAHPPHHRAADGPAGGGLRRAVLVHPVLERVPLHPRVHPGRGAEDPVGRGAHGTGARRHLLLGLADGRLPGGFHTRHRDLCVFHGLLRLRPDGGGDQVSHWCRRA